MSSDPSNPSDPSKEEKKTLPRLEVQVPPKENDPNPQRTDESQPKSAPPANEMEYTNRQKTIAMVLYISIVIATIVTLVGVVWAIADTFMISGKLEAFLALSLGYQISIIGAFAAGFFFILIFFIGLSKKGISTILKITFKSRELEEKYQNKTGIKIVAGALMISVFAIIIGLIISIILELVLGTSGELSFTSFLSAFDSTGPFVLFIGIFLLIMNGLAFSLNWLWYNGYYTLLRIVTDLEKS